MDADEFPAETFRGGYDASERRRSASSAEEPD